MLTVNDKSSPLYDLVNYGHGLRLCFPIFATFKLVKPATEEEEEKKTKGFLEKARPGE